MIKTKKHKFIYLGLIAIALILLSYLFVFPYHYKVSFKTKQPPGVVFSHLRAWPEFSFRDSVAVVNEDFAFYQELIQNVQGPDGILTVHWSIARETDSITRVQGRFSAREEALSEKLRLLFGQSYVPQTSIGLTQSLAEGLIEKSKNFKVHSISDTVTEPVFCAYIPVKTKEATKAQGMLRQISRVMAYIKENNIELKGDPFISVTHWDPITQDLNFDFCFPIDSVSARPEDPEVRFKTLKSERYLKAIFNGNYRISQQGWYSLFDYAQRNNIALGSEIIEIYRNDPHEGGDSMQWVAELLIPILD
jgi:effector-binding domain-containing protein